MYVGAIPTTGDFKLLDSITTSSATTFNLRQGGVAVFPQSANHCIVQLNGVNQVPTSSFNIVNDTIVFSEALTSSDVINQILVLGNVNDIGVPSDDTVSSSKIQTDAINATKIADDSISDEHLDITAITGQTAITSLADTDKFLVSDASDSGNLKYVEKQYLPSGAWTFLYQDSKTSESSGTVNYTESSLFTSTYDTYRVYILNFVPQNDGADLGVRFKLGGVTRTADYKWHKTRVKSDSDSYAANSSGGASNLLIMDSCGNGTSEAGFGWFEYHNPSVDDGLNHVVSNWFSGINTSGVSNSGMGGGFTSNSTGAMSGFTLRASAGGIGKYNMYVYGLKS